MQDLSTSSIVQQTELSSSDGLASSQPLCGQPGEQASALPGSSKASSFLRVPKDFEAPSSPPGPASSPCPDQHRTAGRKARTPATLDDFADREFEVLKERYLEEYQKKYPNGPPSYPVRLLSRMPPLAEVNAYIAHSGSRYCQPRCPPAKRSGIA
jgi:hypothetical protein